MGTIGNMVVKLSLDDRDFDAGVKGAHSSVSSFVDKAGKMGGAMTAGVTLPILGIAAAAVKMSTDFNASMANIASLGVPEAHVKEFKSAIQDLAIETGQSTGDIADGMYQIVSAFGDTKDTVKILTSNVKLAKAGLSSTSEAIALTSAVTKGYNDTSAEMVQHVADLSIQTVALGQTTLPELAGAMGTVTPLAGSLGIKMEDMFAVMATGSGVTGSSGQVATQFRGILQSLMAPTADMTALTKKMGYENGQAMLTGEGLQKTIEAIVGASEATGKPLQSFIGSIEGQTLALALAGPQADAFTKNMAAMQDVAGKADEAFLAQTEGINKVGFSMEKTQRYAEVLGQKVGDALAPLLAVALDKIQPMTDSLVDLVDQFGKADSATQGWVLAGVGLLVALGPLLLILPGIATGLSAIGGAIAVMTGPVGLLILGVALLGVAWATNFGGIQEKTAAAWAAMQPALAQMQTELAAVAVEVQKWLAWAVPEAAKEWDLAIKMSADFTQAAADWLAWAGPEAQKELSIAAKMPMIAQTAIDDWWTDWQAKAKILTNSWSPVIKFAADWASGILATLQNNAQSEMKSIGFSAHWFGGAMDTLWQAAQNGMKSLGFDAHWLTNVIATLWQDAQDWFTQKPISATVEYAGSSKILNPSTGTPGAEGAPFNYGAGTNYNTGTGNSSGSPFKAMGGPVSSGVPYIVGERGAEMFIPSVSGEIIPHDKLGSLWDEGATAGAGFTLINYGPIASNIDINALAWEVAQLMSRRRQR